MAAFWVLPPSEDVDETLSSFASRAHESAWRLRRDALLRNPAEPPPAVRVAELLSWAQSEQGKRLMALAEVGGEWALLWAGPRWA